MPVKLRSADLESASARLRLAPCKAVYRLRLAPGVALGYRRTKSGFGAWSTIKNGDDGNERLSKFGLADDHEPADGTRVFSFDQAMAEARRIARGDDQSERKGLKTIAQALDDYEVDLAARGASIANARRPRPHLSAALLAKDVNAVTADDLKGWRNALLKQGCAPSSINRTRNALRACLELAAPHRSHVWKQGLETLPNAGRARRMIYPDATISALVAEAYRRDHALGLLCDVLAICGMRPIQAQRLRIEDLIADPQRPRLMVSRSAKGGGRRRAERKLQRFPVPITPSLAIKLRSSAQGRADDEPLLLRSNGNAWSETNTHGDYRKDFQQVAAAVGLDPDKATAYLFRHSSIARALLHGVHSKLVADTHDTSEQMLRQHYARFLVEHSDQAVRAALLHHEPPAAANVVPITGR
jgi:integrase